MFKEAWRDTKDFFGWNRRTIGKAIGPAIVGFIILYLWRGLEVVRGEISYLVGFTLGGIGIFFIVVFVWYLTKMYHYRGFRRDWWPEVEADVYGDEQRIIGVKVKNISSSLMKGCYGKLVGRNFVSKDRGPRREGELADWYFPPLSHYFPWFLNETAGNVDIEPNSSESLEVLTCFITSPEYYYVCTSGGIDYQRKYVRDFEYIIEIGWMFKEVEKIGVKITFTKEKWGVNVKGGSKVEYC